MKCRHNTALDKAEFRAVQNESGEMRLEGYFIVYDVETMIFPGCFEKIARGACTESLKNK